MDTPKVEKPKPIRRKKMWAYFAPDGYCQTRSIGETKDITQQCISAIDGCNADGSKTTYKDYEKNGYVLKRVFVTVDLAN
jgi:hypothetical protein